MSKHESWSCDIKDCSNETNGKQKNLQVIFTTEQTEGKSVPPYLQSESIDICDSCMQRVVNGEAIFAYGAQGYNTYYFKIYQLMTPQQQSKQPAPLDIKQEAEKYAPNTSFAGNIHFRPLIESKREGYIAGRTKSLAELEAKDKEILRLKELLKKRDRSWFNTFYNTTTTLTDSQKEEMWQEGWKQYSKSNNL